MSEPNTGLPDAVPAPERAGNPWILSAIGGFAALVLIVGFAVWVGTRDDGTTTSSVASSSLPVVTSSTSVPATTSTSTATSTTTSTTSTSTTTSTTTSSSTTLAPPAFALPAVGDPTWTVDIFHVPDAAALTMNLVTTVGDVSAYDGEVGQQRCIGVVGTGDEYAGWCGFLPDLTAGRFVTIRGITPWLVEYGAATGEVELVQLDSQWRLPTNGCTEPVVSIVAAANLGPLPVTGLACAGSEAFIGVGALLFGDRQAPDGGGILVGSGDEGWNAIGGFGTSIDCDGWPDGVDRCALFGVESELFEALLPIPPAELLTTSTDIPGMNDETATVRTWIGTETDPAAIEAIITEQVTSPDAEVPADVKRAADVGGGLDLLVIEVPAMDDSIRSTTWATWIDTGASEPVRRVFAWTTCARGIAGPGLCV